MPLKLASPQELIEKLGNTTLEGLQGPVELGKAEVEQPVSVPLDEVTFSVAADATAQLDAFNAEGDEDPHGVFGKKPAKDAPPTSALTPQLVFDGTKGWLKYSFVANAKVQAGAKVPYVVADANGTRSVVLAAYRAHPLTRKVTDALVEDALAVALAAARTELPGLRVGDAATYQTRGQLKVTVEVSWADVVAGNLAPLTRLLASSVVLGLKTDLKASVAVTATLTDEFAVVFSRAETGRIRIAVRKAKARGVGITGKLGVEASLQGDAVDKQLPALLDALVARVGATKLGQWIGDLGEQLPSQIPEEVSWALARLGWTDLSPQELQKRWDELHDKAKKALEEAATQKVKAGVQYEWERLSETATLLQFSVPDEKLDKKLHLKLLQADFAGAVDALRAGGSEPDVYFQESKLVRRQAWGFTLGLGKWELGSKEEKSLTRTEQHNRLTREKKLAYRGVRTYSDSDPIAGTGKGWTVDFKCDTTQFLPTPTVGDAQYGLYALMKFEDRPKEKELRRILDAAIAWRVFTDAHEDGIFEQIVKAAGSDKEKIEARLELKLGDAGFRALISDPRATESRRGARALARALPWYGWKCRQFVEMREAAYLGLWDAYLAEGGGWSTKAAADRAAAHLKKMPFAADVWHLESIPAGAGELVKFSGQTTYYPDTAAQWTSFCTGVETLRQAFTQARPVEVIEKVFGDLQRFWTQSLHLRALGALITDLAGGSPAIAADLERTLTVSIPAKDQQLTFSTSGVIHG